MVKIEELEEFDGCLMDKNRVWCIIKDETKDFSLSIMKASGLDKQPIKIFKCLPILKLRNHKIKGHYNHGDCVIGETVYNSLILSQILSLIGKKNVELYQKEENYPLGIKVNDTIACLAPLLIDDEDKVKIPKLEDII